MNNLKYIVFCSLVVVLVTACTESPIVGMPNPWTDCGSDIDCAVKKAGFNFPVEQTNCNFRAMEDMIQIEYPLNGTKKVTIRKTQKYDGNGDISGDYNNYNENREVLINNVKFSMRGENCSDKIHVVNFSSLNGHYAIMSDNDLNLKEVWNIYELIKKADKF